MIRNFDAECDCPENDREAKIPITVVVPVRNEESNLARCLARLRRFAAVIVVDSGSTDRTAEVAAQHGAKVVQFIWNGRFPKKRNWVLMNEQFSTDWILFLDADELLSVQFCDAVASAIGDRDVVGFWLNYTNYFLGHELRHGVRQRKLALFRIGSGFYERIDEDAWSALDMEVHEHPVLDGPLGEISQRIDHRDFRGIEQFLLRHIQYAKWEASRYAVLHSAESTRAEQLTRRQKFKYRHLAGWWYPWVYFAFAYVFRCGFLDGRAGFLYAFYKAWYFETIRTLLREQQNADHIPRTAAAA